MPLLLRHCPHPSFHRLPAGLYCQQVTQEGGQAQQNRKESKGGQENTGVQPRVLELRTNW